MAKSDLIHVQVEGNVFEGKADKLAKLSVSGVGSLSSATPH